LKCGAVVRGGETDGLRQKDLKEGVMVARIVKRGKGPGLPRGEQEEKRFLLRGFSMGMPAGWGDVLDSISTKSWKIILVETWGEKKMVTKNQYSFEKGIPTDGNKGEGRRGGETGQWFWEERVVGVTKKKTKDWGRDRLWPHGWPFLCITGHRGGTMSFKERVVEV